MDTEICVAQEGRSQARQGLVARALGNDVDGAADAAAGRDAVDERTGTLEQLDALDQLRRHAIGRNETVQPVETDVAGRNGEAADLDSVVAACDMSERPTA